MISSSPVPPAKLPATPPAAPIARTVDVDAELHKVQDLIGREKSKLDSARQQLQRNDDAYWEHFARTDRLAADINLDINAENRLVNLNNKMIKVGIGGGAMFAVGPAILVNFSMSAGLGLTLVNCAALAAAYFTIKHCGSKLAELQPSIRSRYQQWQRMQSEVAQLKGTLESSKLNATDSESRLKDLHRQEDVLLLARGLTRTPAREETIETTADTLKIGNLTVPRRSVAAQAYEAKHQG
jgi:hypothetical protein